MDYGKSGAPKTGKGTPRHTEHNAKGSDKNPFGKPAPKADLQVGGNVALLVDAHVGPVPLR